MYGAVARTSPMTQLYNEWWWTIWFATVTKYMFQEANNFWLLSENLSKSYGELRFCGEVAINWENGLVPYFSPVEISYQRNLVIKETYVFLSYQRNMCFWA